MRNDDERLRFAVTGANSPPGRANRAELPEVGMAEVRAVQSGR